MKPVDLSPYYTFDKNKQQTVYLNTIKINKTLENYVQKINHEKKSNIKTVSRNLTEQSIMGKRTRFAFFQRKNTNCNIFYFQKLVLRLVYKKSYSTK
jgi:hypothetical protein